MPTPDATHAVAGAIAELARAGDLLVLAGEMGAGKTWFAKGFAAALGVSDDVTSPTFTLVHEYRGGRVPLIHVDLYRLERADLDDLGIDPDVAAQGIVAVEWAERLSRHTPHAIKVRIDHDGERQRVIHITRDA